MGRSLSAPVVVSPARPVRARYSFGQRTLASWSPANLERMFGVDPPPRVIVPIPQNGSFYFADVDAFRAQNQRYVIALDDPFSLRFIPR